jgi:hypothetical protein
MLRDRPPALPWFCAILLALAAWQAVYCAVATQGKLTGLFYIGERMHWRHAGPSAFVYPDTNGYDGQIYRVIAHDPGMRGDGNALYGPRYWYRRILIPAAAALLGRGSPTAIDFWYVAVVDLVLALGGVCFIRLCDRLCAPALATLVYVMIPAVVASTDRMVVDGPMLALSLAAWWLYRERRLAAMLGALALAVLTRETAICVVAGIALADVVQHQYRRAMVSATAAIPAVAWWTWLAFHTPPSPMDGQLSTPLLPQIARLFWRYTRPGSPSLNLAMQALDVVAVLCLLGAFAWIAIEATREFRAGGLKPDTAIILPMAVAATFFSAPALLTEPYHFMRHASLLLVWVSLRMMRAKPAYAVAYMAAAGVPLLGYRLAPLLRHF